MSLRLLGLMAGWAALLTAGLVVDTSGAEEVSRGEARVAQHYLLHCSGCHGSDGRGTPGATPTLHGLEGLARSAAGRRYLMRVPGVAQAPLDDADLAELLTWVVVRFASSPPDIAPEVRFEAEEVGRWRAEPLRDPLAARRALETKTP